MVPTCGACGARYQDEAWASLSLARRIDPPEVRRLIRDWPDQVCVEVRSCRQCAHPIAAKRPVASPSE
jgi:hypothetical protein